MCAFEDQADAERFYNVLGQRLEKFGLELSAAKTRIIPFSRHRAGRENQLRVSGVRVSVGQGSPGERSPQAPHGPQETPDRSASASPRGARRTDTSGCQYSFKRLNAKLRGYYNYYGVHGNAASLKEFFNSAMRILLKWLNRRSQRHSYTWQGYTAVLERFQSCPTTDRWTTKDEAGNPRDLSRPAEASIPEEPGAGMPHAGICAGACRVTGSPYRDVRQAWRAAP